LRINYGSSITKHLKAFNNVISLLLSVDIKIIEEEKCISLLCSLSDSWESLVMAIEINETTLTFSKFINANSYMLVPVLPCAPKGIEILNI
jgi:hypothetical protein